MIVELEIDDLDVAATALNNARIAYQRVINCIKFGCEVDSIFLKLETVPEKFLDDQVKLLKNLTDQLDKLIMLNLKNSDFEDTNT